MKYKMSKRNLRMGQFAQFFLSIIVPIAIGGVTYLMDINLVGHELWIILILISLLFLVTTFIILTHISIENAGQTGEYKEFFEIIKHWIELQTDEEYPEICELSSACISETKEKLYELKNKKWRIGFSPDIDYCILSALEKTERSIRATHIGVTVWIDEQFNATIFRKNKELIGKGVAIHRIFLLAQDELMDPRTAEIIENHIAIGVDVQCVRRAKINHCLDEDFIIYDDYKVLIEQYDTATHNYRSALVSINPSDILEWGRKFENLSSRAYSFDDFKAKYIPL